MNGSSLYRPPNRRDFITKGDRPANLSFTGEG
jgi:hypothetical protein